MLDNKKRMGELAAQFMSNEIYAKSFESVREHYMAALTATKKNDAEGREYLYKALSIIDDVKRHIAIFIEDGKIATSEIKHLKRGK